MFFQTFQMAFWENVLDINGMTINFSYGKNEVNHLKILGEGVMSFRKKKTKNCMDNSATCMGKAVFSRFLRW